MNWRLIPASQFETVCEAWDGLNRASGALPLLETRFLAPLLREFGGGRELVALCEDGAGLLAAAILEPQGRAVWSTFQPSQAPVGAWLQRGDADLNALLRSLISRLPGFALAVGVTQQDPDLLPRPEARGCVTTLDYIQTARVTLSQPFDAYWEARGKNLKQNMKRQRAKLEKDGVGTFLDVVSSPAEVAEAVAQYGRLESASWKAAGGTAIHPDNAQGRFYRAMLESFCEAGRGRIYRYRFDDRIVAMDLCVEGEDSLIILKTTYDSTVDKTLSPAFLMRQDEFRLLWEEGRMRRVEFYGKLMDWHTKWTDEVRTLYHANHFRWPFLPRLRDRIAAMRAPAHQQEPREAPAQ